ncbi:unnamed protein product [Calypogeia fissa]
MGKEQQSFEAIRYRRGHLKLLDQKRLPHESVYVEIPDSNAAWHAIRDMVVRGAPAIAVTAALALAVEVFNLANSFEGDAKQAESYIQDRLNFLVTSRPTAVNLADASEKLQKVVSKASTLNAAIAQKVFEAFVEAAEVMLAEDVMSNKSIGGFGAKAILKSTKSEKGLKVLTHCNTGSLATAGYGTALGVIRSLHSQEKLKTAYCTETRPYNQGSRLTAYELVHDQIHAVLIADSAATALLASGIIDAVVVGADRIVANGDTANKIGTLSLAVAASQFGVPFFIAAPLTTIDISTSSGKDIVIEERSHSEITHASGGSGPRIAADGIGVWNPAFDVTPAKYIAGIITDKGTIWQDKETKALEVVNFIKNGHQVDQSVGEKAPLKSDNGPEVVDPEKRKNFYQLDEKAVVGYLSNVPVLAQRLGGSASQWEVKEVGDGNLNYVYIVLGPQGSLVLKQSLPHVRCVGESWPMTLERTYFEQLALKKEFEIVPEHVPEVYYFDHPMAAVAMRYLEPPHIILRKGLIHGIVYPLLAEHISSFLAKTLFNTSLLALKTIQHKNAVAESYGNYEMCTLTEKVIFTEPYMVASNNRWTSPQLDKDAKAIREDNDLKLEIAELKAKFCSQTQAFLHGDLHTGSVMVTDTSTQVIDPEFSFYGPSGFDIGAFLGNLIMAYYSQDGHSQTKGDRDHYKRWILNTFSEIWTLVEQKFKAEWDGKWVNSGDAYVPEVYNNPIVKEEAQKRYLTELFHDSLGFAGAKIIRRIVGIAHVEDLESIADVERRAAAERNCLKAATFLLKSRKRIFNVSQVVDFVSA